MTPCAKCKVNPTEKDHKWCQPCKTAYHLKLRELGPRLKKRRDLERQLELVREGAPELIARLEGEIVALAAQGPVLEQPVQIGRWACRESNLPTKEQEAGGWLPDSLKRVTLTDREADLFRLGVNYGKGLAYSKKDFRKLHAFKLYRLGLSRLRKQEE